MAKSGPKPSPEVELRRAYVLECVRANMPTSEIAKAINRSEAYVRTICWRSGQRISRRSSLTDTQMRRITDLVARGMPITHIAETLALSAATVRKFALSQRLIQSQQRGPSPWNDQTDALLRRLYGPRGNAIKLARILKTTKNAVVGRAHRLGLGKGTHYADGQTA